MHSKGRKKAPGISLVEILIAVMIMILAGSIVFQNFLKQKPIWALNETSWELMSQLRLARSIGITQNTRAYVDVYDDRVEIKSDDNEDGLIVVDEIKTKTFSDNGVKISRIYNVGDMAFTGSGRFIKANSTTTIALNYEQFVLTHPSTETMYNVIVYSNGQTALEKDDS